MYISQLTHNFAAQLDLGPLPNTSADKGHLQAITAIVFSVIGGIALLVMTIAGFRYILSQGNPGQTAQARNAMIYAGVGVVVALMAGGIVTFVLGYF